MADTKKANEKALKQPRSPKFKWILGVTVLAAVAFIAAGLWLSRPTATKDETTAALEATQTADEDTKLALLEDTYSQAASAEGKAQAAYYLATAYSKQGDHARALRLYQEADTFYESKDINIILGVAAEASEAKEKEIAKTYYQKAIDYYESHADDYTDVEALVAELQDRMNSL